MISPSAARQSATLAATISSAWDSNDLAIDSIVLFLAAVERLAKCCAASRVFWAISVNIIFFRL